MRRKTDQLMEWVDEYGIRENIQDVISDDGYDAAVVFVYQWFDGWGEADAIVSFMFE